MNVAVIFAGGVGRRMNTKDKPKQFLLVHGKPIIVHTIERFQKHEDIDGIVVVCVEDWIHYLEEMIFRYRLEKVGKVVPGGKTGQMSIYAGLKAAEELYGREGNVVLIHDGVRPMIDFETISENIKGVREYGSAITTVPAYETVIMSNGDGRVEEVLDRSKCFVARAPQSFWLTDVLDAQEKAISEGLTDVIDSSTLMMHYGHSLHLVPGNIDNIKITTPKDFYAFRAIYDAMENDQLDD